MLKEIPNISSVHREVKCRWFRSENADLYVWPSPGDERCEGVGAFEYCYRNLHEEYRLRWDGENGVKYSRVEDGESSPLRNDTPLVTPGAPPDIAAAARHFREEGLSIDPSIYRFILDVLYEQVVGNQP